MEDAQIIKLYFARSEDALGETRRKYESYLNGVARAILKSPEDREEILGDTYLAAWNTIPPERPRSLRYYLARITRNLSLNRLDYLTAQCRDSRMDVLLSELEECLPDCGSSPEETAEAREIGTLLNRFLGTLDAEDCGIFLNRYFYGLTIPEIQKKTGTPQRKIKYRLSSARRKLRMFLEKEGVSL